MVDRPTRGNNVLDLSFTSEDDLISSVSFGECLGTSDHHVIKCRLGIQTNSEEVKVRRKLNFRAANFVWFKRDLSILPRPVVGTIDGMWSSFKSSFMDIQGACIPFKKV